MTNRERIAAILLEYDGAPRQGWKAALEGYLAGKPLGKWVIECIENALADADRILAAIKESENG